MIFKRIEDVIIFKQDFLSSTENDGDIVLSFYYVLGHLINNILADLTNKFGQIWP